MTAAEAVGAGDPVAAVAAAYARMAEGQPAAWIAVVPEAQARARAEQLQAEGRRGRALWGVPFAVKDNIDVAGMVTTAGCPAFAYPAEVTAPAVQRLLDAGAILVGKTNLDQFATGLVGTRSPYGTCHSVLDPALISGGSSSGSAVVVAEGIVPFSLGTDTAGSGRVPAAANGIVGLKPSLGLVSTRGVVPACRSIDCVSVFAPSVELAHQVLDVLTDPTHPATLAPPSAPGPLAEPGASAPRPPGARVAPAMRAPGALDEPTPPAPSTPQAASATVAGGARWRVGVPGREAWGLGEGQAAAYAEAVTALAAWTDVVEVDLTPLLAAGELLYDGAFVAERLTTVGPLLATHPEVLHPVVRHVVSRGLDRTAVELFADQHRLTDLAGQLAPLWDEVDVLACPTVPDLPTIEAVLDDPVGANTALGRWTHGVNLLDLCALTVPAGTRPDGLPGSLSFIGPAGTDRRLAAVAKGLDSPAPAADADAGLTAASADAGDPSAAGGTTEVELAVVGAHLRGLPLHHQLADRGARFVRACRTAPVYRLHVLDTEPPKPGMVRVGPGQGGGAVEAEVWALDVAAFGSFVAEVPPPLTIGTVELEDGTRVKGFLCEPTALDGAEDITATGSWRNWWNAEKGPASCPPPPAESDLGG